MPVNILLPVLLVVASQSTEAQAEQLHIGAFFPLENTEPAGLGRAVEIAANLAIEDVALNGSVLRGYDLQMLTKDTECRASVGVRELFKLVNDNANTVVLFGDACTEVNDPIAMFSKYWGLVQISYAESHPKFSPTGSRTETVDQYSTFYRMLPRGKDFRTARLFFLRHFNWTRIGTIVQSDDPQHALGHEAFTSAVYETSEIKIVQTASFSSKQQSLSAYLEDLKSKDAHIIIGDFNQTYATDIFCRASKLHMIGSDYLWIIPGYHSDEWWYDKIPPDCSQKEVLNAMQGHIVMEYASSRPGADVIANGKVNNTMMIQLMQPYSDYWRRFKADCDDALQYCDENTPLHGYAYDGIWVIAMALDRTIRRLSPSHPNWYLELMRSLNDTRVEGVTGKVSFNSRERLGRIRIAQFRDKEYIDVGEFDAAHHGGQFRLHEDQIFWQDGHIPIDSTLLVLRHEHINFALFAAMVVPVTLGTGMAIAFLVVNIAYRKHRFIKMSSPNMNNLIIVGSLLCYLSVILLGLDSNTVKVWTLCLGFTTAFGSMFSKTWRVHSIFTNIKLNKKAIKDYQLFMLVGAMACIDAIILGVWNGIAPLHLSKKNLSLLEGEEDSNIVILPQVEYCDSKHAGVFQAILFGYKGLLLLLGCYLAWETRHVNVPALNDSKYIGMSVYNVVIMCSVGVALSFILKEQLNESFALISIFIIFCTTLTLGLVFLPKLLELFRAPKGTERKYRATLMKGAADKNKPKVMMRTTQSDSANSLLCQDFHEKLLRASQDNDIWIKLEAERDEEIQDLLEKLKDLGEDLTNEHSSYFKDSAIVDNSTMTSEQPSEDPFGGVYIGPPEAAKMRPPAIGKGAKWNSNKISVIDGSDDNANATELTSLLHTSPPPVCTQQQVSDRLRVSLRQKANTIEPESRASTATPSMGSLYCSMSQLDTVSSEPDEPQTLSSQPPISYTNNSNLPLSATLPSLSERDDVAMLNSMTSEAELAPLIEF